MQEGLSLFLPQLSRGWSLLTPDAAGAAAPPRTCCVYTPALSCWPNTASLFIVIKRHFQPPRTPPVQPMTSCRDRRPAMTSLLGPCRAATASSGGALKASVVLQRCPRKKNKRAPAVPWNRLHSLTRSALWSGEHKY